MVFPTSFILPEGLHPFAPQGLERAELLERAAASASAAGAAAGAARPMNGTESRWERRGNGTAPYK